MTAMVCRKHQGSICEKHCKACDYFDALTYHCLFYELVDKPLKEKAAARRRKFDVGAALRELHKMWEK